MDECMVQASLIGGKEKFQGFKGLWNFERVFLETTFFNLGRHITSKWLHESFWIFDSSFKIEFYMGLST